MIKITYSFITLLFCLIAMTHNAYSFDQSWKYKDWSVSTHGNYVKYNAHGDIVHGHEFGFIKMTENCNQDLLWISWSTYAKVPDAFENKTATIRLSIDDAKFQIEMPVLSIVTSQTGLTVVTFSNFIVEEKFISLLKKGKKIEVKIFAPDTLTSKLDIRTDTFSLNGFTASILKAKEFCE